MPDAIEIVFLVVIAILLIVLFTGKVPELENLILSIPQILQNVIQTSPGTIVTTIVPQSNSTGVGIIISVPKINQSVLANYALSLINKDREQYNLSPVTLSNVPSDQQHSDSMLYYGYFSHWDLFDMKPYMRYTLVGGTDGVTENIAYETREVCTFSICTGDINPNESIEQMEYSMMYNDSICCDNGHRDNILDPNHNEVSIGVAYNGSTIYFTEDFIDNYINWSADRPIYTSAGEVYLDGSLAPGYSIYQIYVAYDPPLANLTKSTVPSGPYGYGQNIAGVVPDALYYYEGIQSIVANTYQTSGSYFNVVFNINKQIQENGPGEYTVEVVLNDTSTGKSFQASSYTIFINSTLQQYVPKEI